MSERSVVTCSVCGAGQYAPIDPSLPPVCGPCGAPGLTRFRIDGAALRKHREDAGLSFERVAGALKSAPAFVWRLESQVGGVLLDKARLEALAKALGLDPGQLVVGGGP